MALNMSFWHRKAWALRRSMSALGTMAPELREQGLARHHRWCAQMSEKFGPWNKEQRLLVFKGPCSAE